MKKPFTKTWIAASALTLGMTVLTPLYVGAAPVETTNNTVIQLEQTITGTIQYFDEESIMLKGTDGKNYFIGLYKFSDKQIKQWPLAEGQEITVEGSIVDDYLDFLTFDVYKKTLPEGVTAEELVQLEKFFHDLKKAAKEDNYEEMEKSWEQIDRIVRPYELANWEPESFEEFINEAEFTEKNVVIKEQDRKQLETLYEEYIKLTKEDKTEEASETLDTFYTILAPYFDELYPPLTFEEYMTDIEIEVPEEELANLKAIYEEALKADTAKNEELSTKLWEQFYQTLNAHIKPVPFEEYIADMEFDIREDDYVKLQQYYEEAIALSRSGEDEKADEKWTAFYNILEPYYEANRAILISASKLTLNGKDLLPEPTK
ncbi:hypothetical protein I6G82_03630 [Lysinibacillus macroides]|uniref:Uncharacterized protein n=1 Tax=Lysinibacillus macroides TaxID=33935 RepID=A0A0M9DGQ4_9BACI|nr:hypothetical protein [Lysinibacillus macroides]KOY81118.1 hypothetical protein ADM90_18350 [Lysinibacillus macroides]QPR68736.1 hypothetical protein I6G82_03630 [Lysinibacillus macroides]